MPCESLRAALGSPHARASARTDGFSSAPIGKSAFRSCGCESVLCDVRDEDHKPLLHPRHTVARARCGRDPLCNTRPEDLSLL